MSRVRRAARLSISIWLICLAASAVGQTEESFASHHASLDKQVLEKTISGLTPIGTHEAEDIPGDGLLAEVDGDALVSLFQDRRKTAYVMVESRTNQTITLGFELPVTISEASHITGLLRRRGKQESITFQSRAGGLRLFRIDPGVEAPNMRPRVMINPSVQYANVILDENGNEIYNEGEIMWDVAVRVKVALDADGRVDAYLSRNGRQAASTLQAECALAKMLNCDAFVALHSDATGDGSEGGGSWTFYADEEGRRLAESIHTRVLEAIRTVYPEVQDRGVREHWLRLYVLHNAGSPASLTEILFHSNPKEREMLKTPEFQELAARAVARGILDYFGM